MEFSLLLGGRKRKANQVMRAGIARHAKLEEEVISYLLYFIIHSRSINSQFPCTQTQPFTITNYYKKSRVTVPRPLFVCLLIHVFCLSFGRRLFFFQCMQGKTII